jgi:peptidyl-prolyl cis-trans isomerase A (cyclophilin A)
VFKKYFVIYYMKKIFLILFASALFSCSHKNTGNPVVTINTNMGDIEVELFPKHAPKTVAAFLSYVDSGFYKNSSFYRVLKNEDIEPQYNSGIIQGGIGSTNSGRYSEIPGIPHEPTSQTGLSHTDGTISLARTTPGTASTEFFICIGNQVQFDQGPAASGDGLGFAAFGRVIKGMPIVRKIQSQKSNGEAFNEQIKIKNIERE